MGSTLRSILLRLRPSDCLFLDIVSLYMFVWNFVILTFFNLLWQSLRIDLASFKVRKRLRIESNPLRYNVSPMIT